MSSSRATAASSSARATLRFVSFNAFALTGGCGPSPNDAELDAFLRVATPAKSRSDFCVRIIRDGRDRTRSPSARAHGHKLILVLAAHAAACACPAEGSAFYQSGFRNTYLPWVQQIVTRFKDDPVIGMWEPINTPVVDQLTLRNFFDVVGGEIHRIDPNHLVESGTHGPWAYEGDAMRLRFHPRQRGIDVASFRDYDTTHTEPPNLAPSLDALAGLGKPLILGEAGMYASINGDPANLFNMMPCLSWTARKDRLESWLAAGFSTELAGVEIWNWTPAEQTTDSGANTTLRRTIRSSSSCTTFRFRESIANGGSLRWRGRIANPGHGPRSSSASARAPRAVGPTRAHSGGSAICIAASCGIAQGRRSLLPVLRRHPPSSSSGPECRDGPAPASDASATASSTTGVYALRLTLLPPTVAVTARSASMAAIVPPRIWRMKPQLALKVASG